MVNHISKATDRSSSTSVDRSPTSCDTKQLCLADKKDETPVYDLAIALAFKMTLTILCYAEIGILFLQVCANLRLF